MLLQFFDRAQIEELVEEECRLIMIRKDQRNALKASLCVVAMCAAVNAALMMRSALLVRCCGTGGP